MPFIDSPTMPFWAAGHTLPAAPPLAQDATADVCVIGAGVAGLTTALLLAREGLDVVTLDAGQPGSGESARTTAHLMTAVGDRYYNIGRWRGREDARLAAQSHGAAIGRIESLIEELGLVCDYLRLDGYLFADTPDHESRLDEELCASHDAGLHDTELCRWPGEAGPRCLRFPRQAQLSPWPYLKGLNDEILRLGGRVYGDTRAIEIEEGPAVLLRMENGVRVHAAAVVVAINPPFHPLLSLHARMPRYRTCTMALPVPAGSVPHGLFWDTSEPRHQARLTPGVETGTASLIVGGEHHQTGGEEEPEDPFERLENWARTRFPSVSPPTHRWLGHMTETIDGLGILGREPGEHDNLYIATGDSGMGMTHGTIAAVLITDLIQGRPNPWSHLYDPGRTALAPAPARGNFNVARRKGPAATASEPFVAHDVAA